ncbi:MAG: protein kinase [Verrucomicrobia bacterium]|nr:protein kinase [Verrucomicrobiota bacterium]
MKADWEQVQEIFLAALDHDPKTRQAFVRMSCGESATTFLEVSTLLRSHDEAAEFIEDPPLPVSASSFLGGANELQPGQVIGGYTIRSLLGMGGMGEVYLADDNELGREVAIKLIKRGFASGVAVRQFRREERILAALNHPNIARLYGGAVTAEGTPYFVMEYVTGERLDDYCDQQRLTLRQRLDLFRKVCAAVSYAHQRLIIHRDLKPANIRVTSEGEPKLLDFGIAKLLEKQSDATLAHTITLAPVMTPDYASPEQTRGEPMTTATDIYSLGVVLYQLLTGEKPYGRRIGNAEEMVRAIREKEPGRPSTARKQNESTTRSCKSLESGAPNPAQSLSRSALPDSRALRRDLDNIVLMALRKEPARRYATVERFSEDIRRYLEGRPVFARKDTLGYRTTKFIGRNRLAVTAAALVTFSLVAGIIATTWQARKARQEEAKAKSVNEFLEQMISYSNPYLDSSRKNGRVTTMTDMLDAAAQRLETGDWEPALKAELERIIGGCYSGQGRQRIADEHSAKYVALASRLYRPDDPRRLPALSTQAWLLFSKGDFAASERLYRDLLPRFREAYRRGKADEVDFAMTLNNFACLRRTQGDSHEAVLLFREVLSLNPQLTIDSDSFLQTVRCTLALSLDDEGNFAEALQTARAAVAASQLAGHADTPAFAFLQTVLGGFLTESGNFKEADAALAGAENILRRYFSPVHLWLGDNLRNQATSLYRQGRFAEAKAKNDEALQIYSESFGPYYDQYPTVLVTKGLLLDKTGHASEGEAVLREALQLRLSSLPKDHFWVGMAEGALGECLADEGQRAEAEKMLRAGCDILRNKFGPNDPRTRALRETFASYFPARDLLR